MVRRVVVLSSGSNFHRHSQSLFLCFSVHAIVPRCSTSCSEAASRIDGGRGTGRTGRVGSGQVRAPIRISPILRDLHVLSDTALITHGSWKWLEGLEVPLHFRHMGSLNARTATVLSVEAHVSVRLEKKGNLNSNCVCGIIFYVHIHPGTTPRGWWRPPHRRDRGWEWLMVLWLE